MEDTAKSSEKKDSRRKALEIAQLLEGEKGLDTKVLSLKGHSSWTDYFVITTGNSMNHMLGLVDRVGQFAAQESLDVLSGFKHEKDQPWMFLDCNDIVVHIMSREAREYYNLEECWFQAEKLWPKD